MRLVYDRVLSHKIGYPNLAVHQAEPFTESWRQFDKHWPWVVPFRPTLYLDQHNIDYVCQESTVGSGWYPIAFGWFDFTIDYFDLIPDTTKQRIKQRLIRILFYYHEGDNPDRIQTRLHDLAKKHGMNEQCFVFVSANTAADWHFNDHACFFHLVNRNQSPDTDVDSSDDRRNFTLLSRQHKWWRATVVADLKRSGLLENSIWSYDTRDAAIDLPEDNPISIYSIPDLAESINDFIHKGPYRCDHFDRTKQNDHHWINTDLYTRSLFHIIVETHFDADQSGGTFLTEKTWKCIKYAQPFVMIGPANTLKYLREIGFRTFDDVLDNGYDSILDPTERWLAVKNLISWIKTNDIKDLWHRCQQDVAWNKKFFDAYVSGIVSILIERLECHK